MGQVAHFLRAGLFYGKDIFHAFDNGTGGVCRCGAVFVVK